MTRELHDDVTVTQAPTPYDEGNGMQAIIKAFVKNPVAAFEIIGMIGGGYGLYYALNYKVDDAKASSEQHYKDLTAENARNYERVMAKLDILAASDSSEISDIKSLFSRGDQRFSDLNGKFASIDVRFTKSEDKLDYITRIIDRTYAPHDQRGELGPRPNLAEGR